MPNKARDYLIPTQRLRWRCDPEELGFRTTKDIDSSDALFGQDRAMEAIQLASEIRHSDFNLFVLGPVGTSRRFAVQELLAKQAANMPVPDDWVYVNNFDTPDKPNALRLPAGMAQKLRSEVEELVDDLAIDIPALFESEDYQAARRAIDEEFGQRQETAMAELAEKAKDQEVALLRTPMGFMLAATKDGEVLKNEDFENLPEDQQQKIETRIATLQEELSGVMRNAPRLDRERRRRIEQFSADQTGQLVRDRVGDSKKKFKGVQALQDHFDALCENMIANAEMFLAFAGDAEERPLSGKLEKAHRDPWFHSYMVNVMVSRPREAQNGAPVITEDLPNLDRLTGRTEHESRMGTLVTDFTMIKPGALHRANGGFLVIDARRLLSEQMAWTALKQCLQTQVITITSMSERLSLMSTTSLEPEPIPVQTRVVLIGDKLLYALLVTLDPDFGELFKIEAEFEDDIDLTPDTRSQFARLIAATAKRDELRPLDAGAVAGLLDEAIRQADDRTKFSLKIGKLRDILREADHYAGQREQDFVDAEDVRKAISEKEHRAARVRDRMRETIARGTVQIDTAGQAVGQVNGLSVVGLGGFSFGRPVRISARTRLGGGKLVDIEREVELGGPLHSKGVLILANYLASTYALDQPFSLHASLVFEQSYGNIDGDSASAAELFALLSSLADVPIRQGLAVTGSVSQTGRIQAIGAVNDKVEGFFETCVDQGLSGDQGVLIPSSNVDHLLLRDDIFEAVKDGKFHVYAIETVDQGIGILTGRPSGERGKDGFFPPGTINFLVESKLAGFAARRVELASQRGSSGDPK